MTTMQIDRAVVEQALEALEDARTFTGAWPTGSKAITNLRAALAQQDEPVKHQHKWFRTGAMEPGQMRCIDCGEWGKEQAEPVQDSGFWGRVAARQASRIKQLETTAQQALEAWNGGDIEWFKRAYTVMEDLRVALAQQAEPVEPVEPVAWVASKDGRVIYDDASTDDGLLRVSGDFENDEQRVRYAKQIVDKLNAAPPQRTMVPLTKEEIAALVRAEIEALPSYPSAVEDLPYRLARAVEKASWEKNHGQA